MQTTTDQSGGVLKLAGELSIYEAERLRQTLAEALETASNLTLDLSEVEKCDASAIQILYSARITADQSSKFIEIREASRPVLETCEALGLPVEALSSPRLSASE